MIKTPHALIDALIKPRKGILVDGQWSQQGSLGSYVRHSPTNGEPLGAVPLGGEEEINRAVAAARAAAPAWRALPGNQRAALLHKFADLYMEHRENFCRLGAMEAGTAFSMTYDFMKTGADWVRYYAGWADKLDGHVIDSTYPTAGLNYVKPEPYGVVALILTWNAPVFGSMMKVIPALAAGNAVVIKSAEFCAFGVMLFVELLEQAGFPKGVINLVSGGPEAGAALVSHPGIDKISFTGGIQTARKIGVSAAQNVVPTLMELGGKSPNMVFADADLTKAIPFAVYSSIVALSGQGCVNPTRLLVQDEIYDTVVEQLTAVIKAIPVGDPLDPNVQMGPVMTPQARDRIMGVIERARREKVGRIVAGGESGSGDLAHGNFIYPTLIVDVPNDSFLAQEEIFGPVLVVIRFRTEAEAIAMANDTAYGLGGYIWTQDISRAMRLADQVEAGSVHVNGFSGMGPTTPFGGFRQSGYGKEGGRQGVQEFLREKSVFIAY